MESIDKYRVYKATVRSINSYNNFDIFNEIIFDRNNVNRKSYYDYSAGVKYHKTQDITFSFKAENIFHKASETSYYRVNSQTFTQEEPLLISPIDRKITLIMEYLF